MPDSPAAASAATPTELSMRVRRWAVRSLSVLLMAEAVLLLAVTAWLGAGIDWQAEGEVLLFSAAVINFLAFAVFYVPLAVLTFLVAVGVLLGRRVAWIVAMIAQALILAMTLLIYFDDIRPLALYVIMLYAIVVVFYLNTGDVRRAFFSRPAADRAHDR